MVSFSDLSPITIRALSWPWQSSPPHHQTKKQKAGLGNPLQPRRHRTSHHPLLSASKTPKLHPPLLSNVKDEKDDLEGNPVWLPDAPVVPKPRASYNAASLAYLGDSIYELYVRCHFLSPPRSIDSYNTLVMGMVCCEAQDTLIKTLLKDDFLSEEERDIVRWGQNVQTNHKRATKRAGAAVYSRASSLETLIGYLYLTNPGRLQEMMKRLGL